MCEADLGGEILELSSIALHQENHPLHPIVQYIFERLAAQAILPKDLRYYYLIFIWFRIKHTKIVWK